MRELEKEKSGSFWNQVEVKKKKKGRECTNDGYMCVVDKMQEKKKKNGNVWMKEKAKNKKSQFKKKYHNIFTINFK